jgi:hypothetical protein
MLTSFHIENYRAFAREQQVEIRPLTLFFGWNSGGKSALVRFLPLLAESFKGGGPPIWLGGDVGRKSTWQELVCKQTGRTSFKFGLTWAINTTTAEWEVNGDLEGRWQEAASLEFSSSNGRIKALKTGEAEQFLGWRGLEPVNELLDSEVVKDVSEAMHSLSQGVQWISGLRARPPRITAYGGGAAGKIRPDGADAIDHLIEAQLRSGVDPVLEITRAFFSALGEDLIVDSPMAGGWRILLQPRGPSKVHVNLCDTGEGYTQVLPVLVALAKARVDGNSIVCLEQPELHLHTKAQLELSNVLVDTVLNCPTSRLLVETHSEILLMSVQLAIAEKKIAPSDVRIYWVEARSDGTSETVAVDFDENGRPKNSSIIAAFNEAIDLGQRLSRTQISA